jgi:hypothetical protein
MALAWMERLTASDEEMEAKRLSVQRAMQQNQQPNPPANAPRTRLSTMHSIRMYGRSLSVPGGSLKLEISHRVIIEIFVKSGKDSTRTLNLVIHRVRFKKDLQKSTLASNGG